MESILRRRDYKLSSGAEVIFQTPDDGYSYFFGYYDKSPLNRSNDKLLAHRVSFDGRDVEDGDIAEVGYFDLKENVFIKVDDTLAWNWQQGSQLQWRPPICDDEIIFNSMADGRFVSIIFNINTGDRRVIPFPVYALHPNGREALGICYERHYWCRPGYCYKNIKRNEWDRPYHDEDGIWRINLETGEYHRIVKMMDIINYKKLPEFDSCNNWLEHMLFNSSGSRFMFFHRWHENGIDSTRCFTSDIEGNDLYLYPDVRFYSHACWKSDDELTIWSKEPNRGEPSCDPLVSKVRNSRQLKAVLRPLYLTVRPLLTKGLLDRISLRSKLINYQDGEGKYDIVGDAILEGNGHQTWNSSRELILLDTYEDRKKYRHLIVYNVKHNKRKQIGQFYSNYNLCVHRADLHPRFNHSEELIVVDSAHKSNRCQLVIKYTL